MAVTVPYTFVNSEVADATEVNSNFDAVALAFDDYLPLAGGTLSGALVLPNSDPTLNNHAARKKYVDDSVAAAAPADGSITAAKLAADAVTTIKVLDAAVTTAKIADDAVTAAKMADAAVDLSTAVVTGSLPVTSLASTAWGTWTPTLKQGGDTVGSTNNWARFYRVGRVVHGTCQLTATASHAAGEIRVYFSGLPTPATNGAVVGAGVYLNQGVGYNTTTVAVDSSGLFFYFYRDGDSSRFGSGYGIGSSGGNWDYLKFDFCYEADS